MIELVDISSKSSFFNINFQVLPVEGTINIKLFQIGLGLKCVDFPITNCSFPQVEHFQVFKTKSGCKQDVCSTGPD